jgi:hypothetical protein
LKSKTSPRRERGRPSLRSGNHHRILATDKEIALSLSVDNPIKQQLQSYRICY